MAIPVPPDTIWTSMLGYFFSNLASSSSSNPVSSRLVVVDILRISFLGLLSWYIPTIVTRMIIMVAIRVLFNFITLM